MALRPRGMTPILILAAGASRRMRGRDKLAEPIDGVPLLRAQAHKALVVTPDVFVALPAPFHPREALVAGLPVTRLHITRAADGMSVSLREGVAALPPCDRFLVLLADLPDLTAEDIRTVLHAAESDRENLIWQGCDEDGRPGHPVLFDAALRPLFEHLSGDGGAAGILRDHAARRRRVQLPAHHATSDLDTPEAWADWRARTGR